MYALSLRTTPGGKFVVYRSEWEEFPREGDWVRVNEHAVSGVFTYRERTKAFAKEYVANHPGCTTDPAKQKPSGHSAASGKDQR